MAHRNMHIHSFRLQIKGVAHITIQSFRPQTVAHLAAVQSGNVAVAVPLVLAWLLPDRYHRLAAEVSRV
jgi:hypothetical protein